MKKIYIVLLALLSISFSHAQVRQNYSMVYTSGGTYTPITGGTVLQNFTNTTAGRDSILNNIPIGFTFAYNTSNYTEVNMSQNGFLFFGKPGQGKLSGWNTPLSIMNPSLTNSGVSTTARYEGAIHGFGAALQAASAGYNWRYETIGTAPNRQFVAQWTAAKVSTDATMSLDFQIVLNETSNVIEVIYGNAVAATSARTASIGLRGGNDEDARTVAVPASTAWSAATFALNNFSSASFGTGTFIPASGDKITFSSPFAGPITPIYNTTPLIPVSFTGPWLSSAYGFLDKPNANMFTWPSYGQSAWKVDTTNGLATGSGWTSQGSGTVAVAAPAAGNIARMHTYNSNANQIGIIDYYVDFSAISGPKNLEFNHRNVSGTDSLKVLFSTDGGATFSLISSTLLNVNWANLSFPLGSSTSSTCVIRFSGRGDFGSDDIGIDNVVITLPCSGTPTAGTINAPTNACTGVAFTLGLSGTTAGSGISYQWQSSATAGGPFTNIGGANSASYSATQSSTTYYQCVVTCANGGATATTTEVMVGMNPFYNCYCAGNLHAFSSPYINSVSVVGSTLNNTNAGNLNNVSLGYSKFPASGSSTGTLFKNTPLQFNVTLSATGNSISLWIDYNQNGVFESTEWTDITRANASALTTVNVTIPNTALNGLTGMRLRTRASTSNGAGDACALAYGSGETHDYTIDIQAPPPCTVPTFGGTITATPSTIEAGSNALFVGTGQTGLTYIWQASSSPTGPFTPVGAPNNDSALITGPIGTFYVRLLMSSISCPSDSSNVVALSITKRTGDDVCAAIPLTIGTNGPINNNFSTVQAGEPTTTTATGFLTAADNTMWFSFVAPASKRVSIHSPDFDTQLALWSAVSCDSILSPTGRTLIASNDDDAGYATRGNGAVQYSSFINVNCLNPGQTYFIQFDAYGANAFGSTRIIITDSGTVNTTFTGANPSYCLPAPVSITLTPAVAGGVWSGTNVSAAGVYTPSTAVASDTIRYTRGGCYSTTQVVSINALPTISASVSANDTVCAGTSVTLNGAGGVSYVWDNGVTDGLAFVPASTTTYTVTGTDGNGCSNTATQTVTVNALPTVTAGATSNSICAGSTVTLNGSGAVSYVWDNGVTNGLAFGPTSTTTYTVTGTDANGCTNTATTTVIVNAQPIASLPATISTCNPTETLDAGNASLPGVSYLWSNGDTSRTIIVSTNGTYSVTITGTGGCSISDTVNVTLNSGVATSNVSAASTSICEGTSTTLVGAPSGGVFSANGTGGVFNATTAGTFDVTYTVTTTCGTAIDTVSITVNANPVTSITASSPTICAGGTTGVTLTGTPSGGAFTVQSGTASALVGNTFNPAATGTWTIVYTFTNGSGCPDTSNINFNVNCTVGLNDLYKGIAAINVVPNPTSGNFDLNISNASDKATIKLLSFDGRVLSSEKVDLNQNNTIKMNISNYANGIYFVNVVSGSINKTIKINKHD